MACPDLHRASNFKSIAFASCMLASVFCLLVSFLVYTLITELRNIHGKILMCYMASLLLGYTALATKEIENHTFPLEACIANGFLIQFGFVASFAWMNIMSFDIWLTFSKSHILRERMFCKPGRQFLYYSLYAWGYPAVLLAITIVMSLDFVPETYIKPNFGAGECWLVSSKQKWCYMYGPIVLLIISNIIFFVWTSINIARMRKETAVLSDSGSKCFGDSRNSQRFLLYSKLFFIMGVNWIMEILSDVIGGPEYYWLVTDIANTLQGVLIFIIFVLKRRVLQLVKERLIVFYKSRHCSCILLKRKYQV